MIVTEKNIDHASILQRRHDIRRRKGASGGCAHKDSRARARGICNELIEVSSDLYILVKPGIGRRVHPTDVGDVHDLGRLRSPIPIHGTAFEGIEVAESRQL